jgi:hypothetical protein
MSRTYSCPRVRRSLQDSCKASSRDGPLSAEVNSVESLGSPCGPEGPLSGDIQSWQGWRWSRQHVSPGDKTCLCILDGTTCSHHSQLFPLILGLSLTPAGTTHTPTSFYLPLTLVSTRGLKPETKEESSSYLFLDWSCTPLVTCYL